MSSPAASGTTAQFLACAEEIASRINREAVATAEGGVRWRIPSAAEEPAGPHLYAGTSGVAFFLAACHRVLGGDEHKSLALRALAPIRASLPPPRSEKIGGFAGLGSLIWAFLHSGLLLEDESLLRDAHAVATEVTPERIASDRSLDVLLGAAGALLALLALDRVAPVPPAGGLTPLERACACAKHLLARRVAHQSLPRAWAVPGRLPYSGFAHGASGISHALLRLAERTGDRAWREAADEGLAFERTLYDPETRNWLDRPGPDGVLLRSWCYGAPGIALGRLGAAPEDAVLRGELRDALATTGVLSLTPTDHLCCGNAGRIEILHTASRRLDDRDLLRASVSLAAGLVRRAGREGRLRLASDPADSTFDPGLFKGASGVGYTLLRLARPVSLPCVLILE
ncbi:MAG TPA: lanthionine synthetase LanC family protein [Thermoanaerobaculia bacterium]|nr:lanthionine synthetase LanC family protein [Thermoanaerobaculia bacterium]